MARSDKIRKLSPVKLSLIKYTLRDEELYQRAKEDVQTIEELIKEINSVTETTKAEAIRKLIEKIEKATVSEVEGDKQPLLLANLIRQKLLPVQRPAKARGAFCGKLP